MADILLVEARFYEDLADELGAGAVAELEVAGHTVTRISVPGALEIPAVIAYDATGAQKFAGYVALGCVIRGETHHFDIVANESARALQELAISHSLAIGNGILTVENKQQAEIRADRSGKNLGAAAARACLRLMAVKQQLRG